MVRTLRRLVLFVDSFHGLLLVLVLVPPGHSGWSYKWTLDTHVANEMATESGAHYVTHKSCSLSLCIIDT